MFDGLPPSARPRHPSRLVLDDQDPINRGLVGWWPLAERHAAFAEDIGPRRMRGAQTGTLTRGAHSQIGWAPTFPGGGAGTPYISVGAREPLGTLQLPISIAAWIKPVSVAGTKTIFAQYTDFSVAGLLGKMLRLDGAALTYYTTSNSAAFQSSTGPNATAGVWQLAGVTLSGPITGPTCRIRVGRTVTSATLAQLLTAGPSATACYIGNSARNVSFGPTEAFNGEIAGVRVWQREVLDAEWSRLLADPWIGAVAPEETIFRAYRRGAAPLSASIDAGTLALTASATAAWDAADTGAHGGDDAWREDVVRLSRRERRLQREAEARTTRLRETLERAYRAATGGDEPAVAAALVEAVEVATPEQREQIAAIPARGVMLDTLSAISVMLNRIQRRRAVVSRDDDELALILSVM